MEQRASVASLVEPRPSSGFGLEDGPSFLEILAAQRQARRAAGDTPGAQPALRRDDACIPIAPPVFTDIDDTDADADLEEDSADEKAPRRRHVFGQGMVEYALVLVLIALVVIVLLGMVGHQVQDVFSNLSRGLAS